MVAMIETISDSYFSINFWGDDGKWYGFYIVEKVVYRHKKDEDEEEIIYRHNKDGKTVAMIEVVNDRYFSIKFFSNDGRLYSFFVVKEVVYKHKKDEDKEKIIYKHNKEE